MRAAWAVARKELLIMLRYPTWSVGLLVWPVLFPAGYVFFGRALAGPAGEGLAAFEARAGTADYVGYVLLGTTLWMVLNSALWMLGSHLRMEQWRGTLEANWVSPASRFGMLAGAGAAQVLQSLTLLGVTLIELRLLYGLAPRGSLALMAVLLALSVLSVVGLGLVFASLVLWVRETEAMVFLVRGLFTVFAGITFPIDVMPPWMQAIGRALPLTYAIRSLRGVALAGWGWDQVKGDALAIACFGIVSLALGIGLFRAVERMARQMGSLAQY
ncbi:MAG TPA: ABC transporter permease [Limnochordales bacterium]